MPSLLTWLLWLIGAYLVGSIPFGLLIGRARGVDIRAAGSGNVGATNVGRLLGRGWGITCFVLDVGKGLGPVLAFGGLAYPGLKTALESPLGEEGGAATLSALAWLAIAAAAVAGHIFPVWLRLRGGKGVATGLGAVLGLWPVVTLPGLAAGLVWLAVVKATGYVSLASMMAAAALVPLTLLSGLMLGLTVGQIVVYTVVTAGLAGLVVLRHRSNIAKLRAGTEPRVAWVGKKETHA